MGFSDEQDPSRRAWAPRAPSWREPGFLASQPHFGMQRTDKP